jgi:hypothetical protein
VRWIYLMMPLLTVVIASQVAAGPVNDQPKHARQGEVVTLHAVVLDGSVAYADVPVVVLGGKRWKTRPLAGDVRWFKVEPTVESMSNTPDGSFRWMPIPYAETEMTGARGRTRIAADVRPTLVPDEGKGTGTMRFQVSVRLSDGREAKSPGAAARRGGSSGGLVAGVHTVSIRRDDSYLGWLTELYGQPYIWASAGTTAKNHQTERLEGSDCADFVTYGRRRQGFDVPYTWTGGLPGLTRRIAAGQLGPDGVYVDDDGRQIPFPQPGDLILFPRHVGAMVSDRGVIGLLDAADVMVHTCFARPREQSLRDSQWAETRIEIRRWGK